MEEVGVWKAGKNMSMRCGNRKTTKVEAKVVEPFINGGSGDMAEHNGHLVQDGTIENADGADRDFKPLGIQSSGETVAGMLGNLGWGEGRRVSVHEGEHQPDSQPGLLAEKTGVYLQDVLRSGWAGLGRPW